MNSWYEPYLNEATDDLRQRFQQCSLDPKVADAVKKGADALLQNGCSAFRPPAVVVAKPGRWWYESRSQEEPRRFMLIHNLNWDEDALADYLDILKDPGETVETSYRLYAAWNNEEHLVDATLFRLLKSDQITRRRMLTQANAVKAIFGAVRSGRYQGVITTDIARFDRTLDRAYVMNAVERLLQKSRLPQPAQQAVISYLQALERNSEEILRRCDPCHDEGRGFLSGSRMMTWLTWVVSLEVQRRWRERGYHVIWVGEDVLLFTEREATDEDYAILEADVREVLNQDLHPLDEGQAEKRLQDLAWRWADCLGEPLPQVPAGYSPAVKTTRDGFRFVGFEFQQVGVHGVRVRISQRTYLRLVWAIKRATRYSRDEDLSMPRLERTARRLAFLLGTPNDDLSAAGLARVFSVWHNREINLQARALDKLLAHRLRLYFPGISLDQLIEHLHEATGIRINTATGLLQRVRSIRSADQAPC